MSRPETELDPQLAGLLRDAVADVDPDDRMADIRARIPRRSPARRWGLVAGGGALVVAATVTAIALAGSPSPVTTDPGIAEDPPPSAGETTAVAAYFVGETPTGDRLYREFQAVQDPTPGLSGLDLLDRGPEDPDYRSLWPVGSFEAVTLPDASGTVQVFLGASAPENPSDLALQQLVYTVRAGFQQQVKVELRLGDRPAGRAVAQPPLDVLSHVNISDPSEGQAVSGTLNVTGVANSNEANVPWRIEQDSAAVAEGFFTAAGWMGTRLFPFSGEIDVSSLDPGSYTLIVETDDPTGGAEGPGPYTDSRSFVIE